MPQEQAQAQAQAQEQPPPGDDLFGIFVETPGSGPRLRLDSIHRQNTVLEIKGLLAERSETAHVTCYHIELVSASANAPHPGGIPAKAPAGTGEIKKRKS